MTEINSNHILNSNWLKDRMAKASYNKTRREKYAEDDSYRERVQSYNKKYNATHKDTRTYKDRKAYMRAYYLANRSKILAKAASYRAKEGYRQKHKDYMKKYHEENGW